MHAGLYRIMAQDGVSINTVNTKNGETNVLNLKLVKYWTPDDKGNPWHNVTLWGDQAVRYAEVIEHNQTVFVEGDLEYDTYAQTFTLEGGEEKTITRNTPSFRRVYDFRLVNVVSVPRSGEDSGDGDDPVAAKARTASKSKKTKSTSDEVPF